MSQNSVNDGLDHVSEDETSSIASASTLNGTRSETPIATTNAKRGRKARKRKIPVSTANAPFKYTSHIKEDHTGEIFGVQFNNHLSENDLKVFATVGKNRITVYECLEDGGLNVLFVFADPAMSEVFYSCAWSYNDQMQPLLAAAGCSGIVRVINTTKGKCIRNFIGHGAAVNEVQFHPHDPAILLSASKDHTLRLWNVKTHVCIAVLGNVEGHRDEVLSADFDSTGQNIISCGMDHALKLWRLDKEEVREAIAASHSYHPKIVQGPFQTYLMNFSDFSTRDAHKNYVDCVRWYGDMVFSKSCDNMILCWKPGRLEDKILRMNETKWTLLHTFTYNSSDVWFVRFCLDNENKILAIGGKSRICMWELHESDPALSQYYELFHPKCTNDIRQVSISADGSVMLAVCDSSTVWRWDRIKNKNE